MARCRCDCHRTEVDATNQDFAGVDSRDFIGCVFACDSCRRDHADVLTVGYEPVNRPPTVWVDPQPSQPDATGNQDDGN